METYNNRYFETNGINDMHPELFIFINKYKDYIDTIAQTNNYDENSGTYVDYFKICSVNNLINLFIPVKILLENNHWKAAKILNRTIFEFLINIEYVFHDHNKIEDKCKDIYEFSLLQESKQIISDCKSGKSNIRNDIDPKFFEVEKFEEAIKIKFRRFIKKDSNNVVKWNMYWNNMSPNQVVKSLNNSKRLEQYEAYYSGLSEFTHCAPIAIMSQVYSPEQLENRGANFIEHTQVLQQANDLVSFCSDILRFIGDISDYYKAAELDELDNEFNKIYKSLNIGESL